MNRPKYSKLDLIGNELMKLEDKTMKDKLFSFIITGGKYVFVSIYIPNDIFLRAQVFCEDVEDLSQETFNQTHLLNILYQEFLLKNKVEDSLYNLYQRLTVHDKRAPSIKSIYLNDVDDPFADTYEITLKFNRKDILRGEMLLSDLSYYYPNHPFTIEMVIEILYIDFLEDVRKGGSHKAVKELLKRLV